MFFSLDHANWALLQSVSICLAFLAWGGALFWCRRWLAAVFVSVPLLLVALFDTAYVLANHYTGVGITEEAVFQLQFGTKGLSPELVRPVKMMVFYGFLPALISILALLVVVFVRRRRAAQRSTLPFLVGFRRRRRMFLPVLAGTSSVILLAAVGTNPGFLQSAHLLGTMNNSGAVKELLKEAVIPAYPALPAHPKSMVHVYVESMERTFSNEKIFPGLLPKINRSTKEGIDFAGIQQVPFTGWTIAGQTASNCGYPGLSGVTSMSRDDVAHPCLTDLLHHVGYTQVFMGSASLKFSGRGDYLKKHGFTTAYGGPDIARLANQPTAPLGPWGAHDDVLFKASLNEFHRLVKDGKPFNLEILTVDTHPLHGTPPPGCTALYPMSGTDHKMLNAVHCEDNDLGLFIDTIRAELPSGAILVVQNDHLMPDIPDIQGLLWPAVLANVQREDRLTVWGTGLPPQVIRRQGSMFDVAPTIYHLLGFPSAPIGFGRDLLGSGPTLIEKHGSTWMHLHMQSLLSLPEFHHRQRITGPDGVLKVHELPSSPLMPSVSRSSPAPGLAR